jgi:hypothetical protein
MHTALAFIYAFNFGLAGEVAVFIRMRDKSEIAVGFLGLILRWILLILAGLYGANYNRH